MFGTNDRKRRVDEQATTRRGIIGSAVAIASGTVLTESVAATGEEDESDETDLVVEDGRLNYTGADSLSALSESPDVTRRSAGDGEYVEVNEAAIQQAVEAFNEAADDDQVEIYEEDGEAYIEPTEEAMEDLDDSDDDSEDSGLSLLCGKNDFERKTTWKGGIKEMLWMDDTLTRRVRNRMLASGAVASGVASLAAASIIGVKAGALVGLAAALMGEEQPSSRRTIAAVV